MAYIGNTQQNQSFVPQVDFFSGNGVTTAFTLSRTPQSVYTLEVVVANVVQNPSDAYTLSGNTITFTSAPPSGTNNIYVYYTSPNTQVVQPGQGTVGTTQLQSNLTLTNPTYTGTLTGGTGVVNIGSGQVYKDSSGNVGIGTSSPVVKLDVRGSVNLGPTLSTGYGATTDDTSFEIGGLRTGSGNSLIDFHSQASVDSDFRIIRGAGANADAFIMQAGSGAITFCVAGASGNAGGATEAMRVTSDGRLLVGTTSIGSNTSALYVNGSIGGAALTGRQGQSGTSNGNSFNFWWTGSAAQIWVDTTNLGNIQISSDYRVKQKVETQELPAIERIMKLRPVTYELADYKNLFKADGVAREGFIAHELAEVIPSAVEGEKDDENQIQSLKLDALCSVFAKAIQELKAEVDDLKAQLEAK